MHLRITCKKQSSWEGDPLSLWKDSLNGCDDHGRVRMGEPDRLGTRAMCLFLMWLSVLAVTRSVMDSESLGPEGSGQKSLKILTSFQLAWKQESPHHRSR